MHLFEEPGTVALHIYASVRLQLVNSPIESEQICAGGTKESL